jgi:hypothetical protein
MDCCLFNNRTDLKNKQKIFTVGIIFGHMAYNHQQSILSNSHQSSNMPRRKRNPNKPAPPKPSPLTYGLQTANDPSKNYLLTRLPPELRNKIYRLVLPSPTIVKPRVFSLFQAAEHREFTLLPFLKHEKGLYLYLLFSPLFVARAFETHFIFQNIH